MTSLGKRRDLDIMKLMMSNYAVEMLDETNSGRTGFKVKFYGPKDTAYEGGIWYVHVDLPVEYPYHSPSIGFMNHIYHPNVDFHSGSVCLDVINQTWSPMFDLVNVFDAFLPQLLSYPNPADPLNGEAASLLLRDEKKFKSKVKELIQIHATKDEDIGVKVRSRKSGSVNLSTSTSSSVTFGSSNSFSPISSSLKSNSLTSSVGSSSDNNSKTPSPKEKLFHSNNNNSNNSSGSSNNNNNKMERDHDLSSLSDHEEEDLAADMEL